MVDLQNRQYLSKSNAAVLMIIVLAAFYSRYLLWASTGGFTQDYIEWAVANHAGTLSHIYLKAAAALASGDILNGFPKYYPVGYPAFVAIWMWSGIDDVQPLRLLQAGFDSLSCVLVFLICRDLKCSNAASLTAALGYAVLPSWSYASTFPMAEAVVPAFLLILIFLMLPARGANTLIWAAVGLVGAVLASLRSELTVVVLPLCLWAFLTTRNRAWSVAAVLTTFLAITGALALLKFHYQGQFGPKVFYYALVSGLGQFPNDLGFYRSDALAGAELAKHGLRWQSTEAELHWKSIYFGAWLEHPLFVIGTTLKRIWLIAFQIDQPFVRPPRLEIFLASSLAIFAVASIILVVSRRWLDLLIIAGPLLLAIGSIGWMYVEHRYVRYAGLSQLFALAIVISKAGIFLGGRKSAALVVLACGVLLAPYFASVFSTAHTMAFAQVVADDAKWIDLPEIKPVVPGAAVEALPDGTTILHASNQVHGYQGMATLPTSAADVVVVNGAIEMRGATGSVGILSGDGRQFYQSTPLRVNQKTQAKLAASLRSEDVKVVFSASDNSATFDIRHLRYQTLCWSQDKSLSSVIWSLFPSPSNAARAGLQPCRQQ